jgi:addiction module RelB/DinJ family antitoxin
MLMDCTIRARVDRETKEKAEAILEEMGLNMSVAIRMYLKQLVRKAQEK